MSYEISGHLGGNWGAIGDPSGSEGPSEGLLGTLLDAAHFANPDELAGLVNRAARIVGIRDSVIYLSDYEQHQLLPLAGEGVPPREALLIDQTFGGRAYRSVEALASETDDGGVTVWLPLLDGTSRIGVLEATVEELDPATARRCRQLAALVAVLVVTKELYSDTFPVARRVKPLSLAAELQWSMLPPLAFSDGRVSVSGALEPSYRIAGDSFDYALVDGEAHVAVIDAMGHGFDAAVMASVAVTAYRHARRSGLDLADTYAAMDEAVRQQFPADRFATAQIARLDALSGTVTWVNAGHPPPMILRGTRHIGPLDCTPSLPLGLGGGVEEIAETRLEPGDRLFLFSDGILEARSSEGSFFGEGPMIEVLERALSTALPPAEILRRLLRAVADHQEGDLVDDATTVLVEWRGRDRLDPYRALEAGLRGDVG